MDSYRKGFYLLKVFGGIQMVERLDEGALPPEIGPLDYEGLFRVLSNLLFSILVLLHFQVMQSNNHSCSWELNALACLLKCCMC